MEGCTWQAKTFSVLQFFLLLGFLNFIKLIVNTLRSNWLFVDNSIFRRVGRGGGVDGRGRGRKEGVFSKFKNFCLYDVMGRRNLFLLVAQNIKTNVLPSSSFSSSSSLSSSLSSVHVTFFSVATKMGKKRRIYVWKEVDNSRAVDYFCR